VLQWGAAPPGAPLARAAGDLERDADQVTRHDGAHAVADLDHPPDPLVPERKRALDRHGSPNDQRIQVAGGHHQRPDKGLLVGGDAGLCHLPPFSQPGCGDDHEDPAST